MVHLHDGILHSYKKKEVFCGGMDAPGAYYAGWGGPVRGRQAGAMGFCFYVETNEQNKLTKQR